MDVALGKDQISSIIDWAHIADSEVGLTESERALLESLLRL